MICLVGWGVPQWYDLFCGGGEYHNGMICLVGVEVGYHNGMVCLVGMGSTTMVGFLYVLLGLG